MKLTLIKEAVELKGLNEEENQDELFTDENIDSENSFENEISKPDEELPVDNVEPIETAEEPAKEPENVNLVEDDRILFNTLNGLVNSFWGIIDQLGFIKESAAKHNVTDGESFKNILESITDDVTINIGMLYKLIQLCNPEISILLDKGKNKADETILQKN